MTRFGGLIRTVVISDQYLRSFDLAPLLGTSMRLEIVPAVERTLP